MTTTATDTTSTTAEATGLHLYGVGRTGSLTDPPAGGVRGATVGQVNEAGLVALVSRVPAEGMQAEPDDLVTHHDVVAQAAEASAFLPAQFGIVAPDEDALRALLSAYGELLHRRLDTVEGHVQLTVKAYLAEDAVLRDVLTDRPDLVELRDRARAADGAEAQSLLVSLGEQVAAEIRGRRETAGAEVGERIAGLVADAATEPLAHEDMAFHTSYLVPRDRVDEVRDAAAEAERSSGGRLTVTCSEPFPPYSFASVTLTARDAEAS